MPRLPERLRPAGDRSGARCARDARRPGARPARNRAGTPVRLYRRQASVRLVRGARGRRGRIPPRRAHRRRDPLFPGKDAKSGGDRVPDQSEIANCAAHLDREIALLRPRLVIAVGTLASAQLTGIAQLKDAVGCVHRVSRAGRTFDVVVLPHPSGRSTWLNKPENARLLAKSLKLIAAHAAFGQTFRR